MTKMHLCTGSTLTFQSILNLAIQYIKIPNIILCYFQVQFLNVSAVFAIQTQGRTDMDQWVTTYRIEHSLDCVIFNNLLDVNGNNKVK